MRRSNLYYCHWRREVTIKNKKLLWPIYATGVFSLGLWFWAGQLSNSFLFDHRSPDPTLGRVIPFDLKGGVFYITEHEQTQYQIAFYGGIALFVVYAATYSHIKKRLK